MSFTRSIVGATALMLSATLSNAAGAQTRARTACKDGTTSVSMSGVVCNGHGGVDAGRTEVLRRTPGSDTRTVPGRVTQAGSPSAAPVPQPSAPQEERRGWRWHRHHDEARHEERREERRERRYRCRDGKWETVHGKAYGKEICRKHGGVAHVEH